MKIRSIIRNPRCNGGGAVIDSRPIRDFKSAVARHESRRVGILQCRCPWCGRSLALSHRYQGVWIECPVCDGNIRPEEA